MNKKFLLLTLTLAFTLSAEAYVTSDELTSPEALLNYNYSTVSAEQVQLVKAQNANRPYRNPRYSKKSLWRRFWEYLDPSTDDGYLMQHDVMPGQSWKDY